MTSQVAHERYLAKSSALSAGQVRHAIPPLEVIAVLNAARISFVLVGAHGLAGWTKKPRATQDVDVVVASKHMKKATRVLLEAFPHLEADEHEVVIRLKEKESGEVSIDLIKPVQTLYRETFKHTHGVTTGSQAYRIPSLEMALAMKFAAMLSPLRAEPDKHLDAHDFIRMVQASHDVDAEALSRLGELVYGGGGTGILEMVRKVRAGEKLTF